MVFNNSEKTDEVCVSCDPLTSKVILSKSSVKSKIPVEIAISKNLKCSPFKKNSRGRSKTIDGVNLCEKASDDASAPVSNLNRTRSLEKNNKSKICLKKKECKMEEEKNKNIKTSSNPEKLRTSNPSSEERNEASEYIQKKRPLIYSKPSETFSRLKKDIKKPENSIEPQNKRPSEIPKLLSIPELCSRKNSKIIVTASKLPIRTITKEIEGKAGEPFLEASKTKSELIRLILKRSNTKSNENEEEKVDEAMNNNFSGLVPFYQKELKKITDVWVNSVYCSLTLRTNLVKLLLQEFPSLDRSQFRREDEILLYCIANAKNCTKSEAENLMQFIRSLIASQEKVKQDYAIMVKNKEIAKTFSYDWRELTRKIAQLGEETKKLQIETPELLKKKEELAAAGNEQIEKLQKNLHEKDEEIQKLINQLELLKQRENSYKGNIFLKVEDYKDIKADVLSLISIKKEYEELKAKHIYQNDIYEKKIKELEILLEEKKKILDKETEVKKQLQTFLSQLQGQQNRICAAIGREQFDYVMKKSLQGREKRRDQLWVTAMKLVIRGFLIQIKKLERDRNKMLLQLQTNDDVNFRALTNTIIQKDNFIKSVKHQVRTYRKTIECPNANRKESTSEEN